MARARWRLRCWTLPRAASLSIFDMQTARTRKLHGHDQDTTLSTAHAQKQHRPAEQSRTSGAGAPPPAAPPPRPRGRILRFGAGPL
eukprot:484956-Prymnesium_polylepis.1